MATLALAASASAQHMRIEVAEPVALAATPGTRHFEALGQSFTLVLENNTRLLQSLPAAQKTGFSAAGLMKGRLKNVPGSWARLSRVGRGLEGAIWDGRELYVVTSYGQIAHAIASPLAVAPGQTVVFRLSDVTDALPAQYCGVEPTLARSPHPENSPRGNVLEKYRETVAELRQGLANDDPMQLEIALLADTEFQTQFGDDSTDAMLARLNLVDGIFSGQVGVLLAPADIRLMPAGEDPFDTVDPEDLLSLIADYRENDPVMQAASGVTHLMTGKSLGDNRAGIAYTGAVCHERLAASLSNSSHGTFLSSIVMAHELGHNFGAPHDGVAGACASTPQTFLMAPVLDEHTRFSQCSLDAMAPHVQRARQQCLVRTTVADVSVEFPPSPLVLNTRRVFSVPVTVLHHGNVTATAVGLEVTVPLGKLAFESVLPDGGNCEITDNVARCALGDLAPGEQRLVEARLLGTTLGPFEVQAHVAAENDRIAGNNTASVQVGLQASADLGLSVVASPAGPVYVSDAIDITVEILSRRTQPVTGGTLRLDLAGIPIESVLADTHDCVVNVADSSEVTCQLSDIPAQSAASVSVRARPDAPGNHDAAFSLRVPNGDTPLEVNASARLEVLAEAEVRTHASVETLTAVVDTPYEVTYTLVAMGRHPSTGVTFHVDPPSNGVLEAVAANGVACNIPEAPAPAVCAIGLLTPGETREILVRGRALDNGSSTLVGRTQYFNGGLEEMTEANVAITNLWRVDASLLLTGTYAVAVGQSSMGVVSFQSLGAEPAQNVVVTVNVPAPARITGFTLLPGAPHIACGTLSSQQLRCSGFFDNSTSPPSGVASFTFVSDEEMEGEVTAIITADDDADSTNDSASASLHVQGQEQLTDLRLSVADTAVAGVLGARLHFPLITVTNGDATARHVAVDIPIPAFATLDTVSSSALCSGTSSLQCTWFALSPGESATIDLYLLGTAVGSFSSQVTARADNDPDSTNNNGAVSVTVTEPHPPTGGAAPPVSSGKKGGGDIEWLSLAVLGLLWGWRSRRAGRRGVRLTTARR